MASIKPTTVPTKRLAASINSASMSFVLNNIEGWDGVDLTSGDFGTKAYGVFRNTTNTVMELFEYDPSTIASASITILRRGLKFTGDLTTEVTANKLTWIRNETLVELGSDVPQLLAHYVDDLATQTISGIKTFSETTMPRISAQHTYGAGEEEYIATKRYVDDTALSGAPDASTTQKGVAEEATAAETMGGTAAGSAARLFVNPAAFPFGKMPIYAADAGSNDTYVITPSPAYTAYATGMIIAFKPNTNNTGACTINVNGLGAKSIKIGSSDPADNNIVAGQIYHLVYDGTNFQLTNVISSVPTGSIQMFAGSAAPTGYLLCDGTSYLRADYAALFATISTTYGTADGTHFNVPDMRGRVPVGVGTGTGGGSSGTGLPSGGSALTAIALGTWKGEETHVLTVGELAAHTHTYPNGPTGSGGLAVSYVQFATTGAAYTGTTTATWGSAGSDTAHNNIQPVMGVNFIIKT